MSDSLGEGLYVCGVCGCPVTVDGDDYVCEGHVRRGRELVDEHVVGTLVETMAPSVKRGRVDAMEQRVATHRQALDRLGRDRVAGRVSTERWRRERKRHECALERLKEALKHEECSDCRGLLRGRFERMGLAERRRMVGRAMRVVIEPETDEGERRGDHDVRLVTRYAIV
jgi:hypothetical protein